MSNDLGKDFDKSKKGRAESESARISREMTEKAQKAKAEKDAAKADKPDTPKP